MKPKKIIAYIIIALLLPIYSCKDFKPQESEVTQRYKGNHELRKLGTYTTKEGEIHGSYFLIGGSMSGSYTEKTKIRFSWLNNKGEYEFSEIGYGGLRLKFHKNLKLPYITFAWYEAGYSSTDGLSSNIHNVAHITVHCKEEDFPTNINIKDL